MSSLGACGPRCNFLAVACFSALAKEAYLFCLRTFICFRIGIKAVLILREAPLKSPYACQWTFDSLADTKPLILQFLEGDHCVVSRCLKFQTVASLNSPLN